MNDLQIDYFMAVATNLSFTKTSEELYVSQPAISKQIALMEKELGTKLFNRNNKKTSLTEAGEMYYKFFSDCKLEFRNIQRRVAMLEQEEVESIRIGFIEGWDLSPIVPGLMEEFRKRYPNTEIAIYCCGAKELSTLLLTGGLDLILTMENSLYEFGEMKKTPVASIRKILLYSSRSPLASREKLTPADFRNEQFFAPWGVAEKMITRVVHAYCQPYGFHPDLHFVHNNESMITCVRNNLGVAFSDEWTWAKDAEDLAWIPLEDARDTICTAYIEGTNSEHTLYAAEVLEAVVRAI